MKKTILISILVIGSLFAKAGEPHDYDCIAQSLQAFNSDIYYNLTPSEIDQILSDKADSRFAKTSSIAFQCDSEARSVCDDELTEAKFVGHIQNLTFSQDSEAGNIPHTTFGIGKFISFKPNPFCGLSAEQAKKASFWVQGETILNEGQEVSGVIRYSPSNGNFTLLGVPVSR